MAATPLTVMTTNAIMSLKKEDLNAALYLANTQANTNLTTEDIVAALILVDLSASSVDKSAASMDDLNNDLASENSQASEIDSQPQERRSIMAAYQRQRRAKRPKGHRKAEYRKYIAKETSVHREERLRKKRESGKAKREKAKRAQ